jgi:hypothetical protein
VSLEGLKRAIVAKGLAFRGAFHPNPHDLPAGIEAGTLVLVGFVGRDQWPEFAASPEARDGAPDPLDRWSQRVVGGLAEETGARAIFPFGGPPWAPFLRWAQMAEPVHPSPLGMLIHPDWGLWHAWRGALAFRRRIALPPPDRRGSPCDSCRDRPCLTACPVSAFAQEYYDNAVCTAHIRSEEGADCVNAGCRARLACPVGAAHRYGPDQARFHMQAFLGAKRR